MVIIMPNPISIKDQACHTFALSGDVTGKRDINALFEDLTNRIGFKLNFGEGLNDNQLFNVRQQVMNHVAKLRDETVEEADDLYVCGGFREGQVSPEHLWLEDRTTGYTYDTFINQPIIRIKSVGVDGMPFRPGCEGSAFKGDEIFRVKVSGYTAGQVAALTAFAPKPSKLGVFSGQNDKHDTTKHEDQNRLSLR
ncbi:hypothetical protein Lsan_0363 [Legionella santicrucis]|uniref:Uncharacterized protein n=2 Tax=Legionella santicrucis TaxID=45074 RepID=A0A0W0ZEE3_9GAMM|nr:hypothetical protein Lsan_0363 [Legionella santicrucis]